MALGTSAGRHVMRSKPETPETQKTRRASRQKYDPWTSYIQNSLIKRRIDGWTTHEEAVLHLTTPWYT